MPATGSQTAPRVHPAALLGHFKLDGGGSWDGTWRLVPGTEIPQPQRGLLDHASDMTSTLDRFHGDRIDLEVLEHFREEDDLYRHVILRTRSDSRAVEHGAIRIDLGKLPPQVVEEVTAAREPLGAVIVRGGLPFVSCPQAFFRYQPGKIARAHLNLDENAVLYGRCNQLLTAPGGLVFAEIVEILPN